jgi:hypothetical protein
LIGQPQDSNHVKGNQLSKYFQAQLACHDLFERKCGRGSPYSDFWFFENKNPNSRMWGLKPG